ncbi:hypothetical protein XENOCAPTIV_028332 [Xenoophorus captivus]|uniref:Carbonic anhydrase 4 n=1 Tax=Xenoophorus captivus TaxID=1517983 RepID=A0ABV0SDP0_9TELE
MRPHRRESSHCVAFSRLIQSRSNMQQLLILPALLASFWTVCTGSGDWCYQSQFTCEHQCNGEFFPTVKVGIPITSTISGGGLLTTYKAVQFHLHWGKDGGLGSEHTIDGEQYPMELRAFSKVQFRDSKSMVNNFRPIQPLNGRQVFRSGSAMLLVSSTLLAAALAMALGLLTFLSKYSRLHHYSQVEASQRFGQQLCFESACGKGLVVAHQKP